MNFAAERTENLVRVVALACADAVTAASELDPDGVPAAVFRCGRRVAEVILLTEFVGDAGSCRIEIAWIADDFGSTATVVGHVAKRHDVHPIVARPAA